MSEETTHDLFVYWGSVIIVLPLRNGEKQTSNENENEEARAFRPVEV